MKKHRVFSFDELCKSHQLDYTGDEVVAAMQKSLTTTNSGPITVPRTSPLMLENMDGLMTEVLLTEQHFKLFNSIQRVPSAGPYFEWNRHTSFGTRRGSIGFAEGGGPKGGTSAFSRHGVYNKYLGVRGGLTHQMLVSGQNGGTVEDPETRENHDRAMELFERLEREIIFGNKAIKDGSGNEVHFDGLLTLMAAQNAANIIDKQGAPLTYEDLDNATVKLVKDGKQISVDGYTSYMSVHVTEGLNKMYQDRNIIRESKGGSKTASYVPGFRVPSYDTQFGTIEFEHTLMLEEIKDSAPLAAADSGAPAAPATCTTAAASDATSKLAAATYYYTVAAFNDSGESLGLTTTGQAITAGQKCTLTIADTTGATGFRVYRGLQSDGSDAKWIGRVAKGTTTTTFVDQGGWMTVDSSGGEQNGMAVIIKPDPRDLVMSQMAPLMKMPLPQSETTFPFLLLLYCALVLKAPERVMIYKNCGKYTPA